MKRFFVIIIYVFSIYVNTFSINAVLNTYSDVSVYSEPTENKEKVIKLFHRNVDTFFDISIEEQQENFYFVSIYDEQLNFITRGWVNKEFCGLFARYKCVKGKCEIKIYNEPHDKSSFYKVENLYDQFVLLLDYKGEWRKVLFFFNNAFHEGWINSYCDNSYNSCT